MCSYSFGVGQDVSEQRPELLLGWFKYRCCYVGREGRNREVPLKTKDQISICILLGY